MRYVHGPQGIAQQQNPDASWSWPVQDGRGSVRQAVDDGLVVSHTVHYAPYGEPWGSAGSEATVYSFTGEVEDPNGLVHLRAQYYRPEVGVFPSLDPVEGSLQDGLALNRYGYVQGDPVNRVDPSGMIGEVLEIFDQCQNLSPACSRNFTYNRINASEYAIHNSRLNFNSLPPLDRVSWFGFKYSGYLLGVEGASGSATFASETFWAGGFPMTVSETNPGLCSNGWGGDFGWRVCEGETATENWKNHQGIIRYLSSSLIGGRRYPLSTQQANLAITLSTGVVHDITQITGVTGSILSIQAGDYVYIDTRPPHGLVVVGWGPAANCQEVIDRENGSSPQAPPALSIKSLGGNDVPYVTDYVYSDGAWTQDPRPRPFYCTRYLEPGRGNFSLHSWVFYTIPDVVNIPCNRIFYVRSLAPLNNRPLPQGYPF